MRIIARETGDVLWADETETVKEAVTAAVAAQANLSWADLIGADLTGAYLHKARLAWADLTGAQLTGANLTCANLHEAILAGATLIGAHLSESNLVRADLTGAHLTTNGTWEDYITTDVPALLTAGGKSWRDLQSHWDCHDWDSCPIAYAFGVYALYEVPDKWRAQAAQFIALFDNRLIPYSRLDTLL